MYFLINIFRHNSQNRVTSIFTRRRSMFAKVRRLSSNLVKIKFIEVKTVMIWNTLFNWCRILNPWQNETLCLFRLQDLISRHTRMLLELNSQIEVLENPLCITTKFKLKFPKFYILKISICHYILTAISVHGSFYK